MPASNNGGPAAPGAGAAAELARAGMAMAAGALGFTVRCTPRRRTVMAELPGMGTIFAKVRTARLRDARAERRWLEELPALGLQVPAMLAFGQRGRTSVLVTRAAAGRPLDVLLHAAFAGGDAAAAVRFATAVVAPLVRQLHERGLVFRDLYWNHLFAADLSASAPVWLDVERVFRPRWWLRRWRVKDLAGLLASAPAAVPPRAALRFLCAYLRGERGAARRLARDVARKAARIRAHVPRYG